MDEEEVTNLHRWQGARLYELRFVTGKHIARLTQGAGDDRGFEHGIAGRAPDTDLMERPIHCRPDQITKTRIHHDEGLAWSLSIRFGPLHIGDAGDHRRGRRDQVATWLNFHADGASGLGAEALLGFPQEMPKGCEIGAGSFWAIEMGNTTPEVDGLHVRVGLETPGEKVGQMLH